MKNSKLLCTAVLILSAAMLQAESPTPASARLEVILAERSAPETHLLAGEWHYSGNSYVFFKEEGETPSKELADENLRLMTVTPSNCVLRFLDERFCTFRVGDKKFRLTWRLNHETREFRATVALFSIKGYLVQKGDCLELIYSKPNLFMMMNFLCPRETHQYIRKLSTAMDCTEGLSLGITFSKE